LRNWQEKPRNNWLKLEIHRSKYLMPDAIETLKARGIIKLGFIVLPYIMLILFYANI
jgi:thiazole synthase ThiGH ThiG subunit